MKFRLSSPWGALEEFRMGEPHRGIDLAIPEGTELRSVADGIVTKVFDGGDAIGRGVAIQLDSGETCLYGHMSDVSVKVGEKVGEGSFIGLSGNTGHSTGAHLHFGLQDSSGAFLDPTAYIEQVDALAGTDWSKGTGILTDLLVKGGKDTLRENAEATILEVLKGAGDAVLQALVDLFDGFGLLATGVLVLTGYVGGHQKSKEYAGLVVIVWVLLKFLFS